MPQSCQIHLGVSSLPKQSFASVLKRCSRVDAQTLSFLHVPAANSGFGSQCLSIFSIFLLINICKFNRTYIEPNKNFELPAATFRNSVSTRFPGNSTHNSEIQIFYDASFVVTKCGNNVNSNYRLNIFILYP